MSAKGDPVDPTFRTGFAPFLPPQERGKSSKVKAAIREDRILRSLINVEKARQSGNISGPRKFSWE